jgi:hypothetical protein
MQVSLNGRSCSFSAPKKPIVKTTEQPANQKKDYSKKVTKDVLAKIISQLLIIGMQLLI